MNSTAPHELHKARRQPLNQFSSKTRVAARQDIIDRNVIRFCDRISQLPGETANLGAAISALIRDISCEFMLNKTYASLDEDDFNIAVTNMLQEGGFIWRITKHSPFFGPMTNRFLLDDLFKVVDDGTRSFLEYIKASHTRWSIS